MFLFQQGTADQQISVAVELDDTQKQQLAEAWALWDDVSGLTTIEAVDDDHLARDATTWISGLFGGHYAASLGLDWSRVVLGFIAGDKVAGVNKPTGTDERYHEIFIGLGLNLKNEPKNDGVDTFAVGSPSFHTLLHEIGHSVLGPGHPDDGAAEEDALPPTVTVMSWVRGNIVAATPMPLDIDRAIAAYGPETTTRTGDDTYGFHASFSNGQYRSALDFNSYDFSNPDWFPPLITIFDNGGFDTLDESAPIHNRS